MRILHENVYSLSFIITIAGLSNILITLYVQPIHQVAALSVRSLYRMQ